MIPSLRPIESEALALYLRREAGREILDRLTSPLARQIKASIIAQNGADADTAIDNALAQLPVADQDAAKAALCISLDRITGAKMPLTLADLTGTLSETRWLWPGYLARGYINQIASDPGVGKSAFALGGLVACIISETVHVWPDGSPVDPADKGYILWIDTESSQALLLERAQGWRLPLGRICLPPARGGDLLADVTLDDPEQQALIEQLLCELPIHMVVVDSLRGAHQGDENSSDVNGLMSWLASLARDHQVAVLIIHHLKKNGDNAPRQEITPDMVRGSSAITAMCRIVMAIDRPDPLQQERKRLKVIKSNLGKLPAPVGFEVGEGGLTFAAAPFPPRKETQQDKAADLLLTLLAHKPVLSKVVYERAEQEGISERTLKEAKKRMGIESVKKDEQWFMQLPGKGTPPGPLHPLHPLHPCDSCGGACVCGAEEV